MILTTRPAWLLAISGAVLLTALAATGAPLLVYSVTLAVFGLPHVLSELRYVSRRFGPDLGERLRLGLVILLGGVLLLRGGRQLGWWEGLSVTRVELLLALSLALLVAPALWRAGGRPRVIGLGLLALGAIGVAISPVHTLFALAIAHNWTPVGFFADAYSGARRRGVMLACFLVFLVVPLLIASGLPMQGLSRLGLYSPEQSVLPTGPLAGHLGAYLAPDWRDRPWTEAAFQALVYAQCLHYAAVLLVLPRLQTAPTGWPARLAEIADLRWSTMCVGAALVSLAWYSLDFAGAKGFYSLPAGVHAWVELPLLLLAMCPPQPKSAPTPKDAALAARLMSAARPQETGSVTR